MFDIGWSELLIVGIVALIVIGPKELPGVLRMVGQYMGKIRRMASEFQGQFQEAMREAEMDDLKKQVDEMTSTATDFSAYDPMEDVRKDVDSLAGDLTDEDARKPAEQAAGASPEAAPQDAAAPVSPDFAIPQSEAASDPGPEAPQPKVGSG